MFMALQNHSLQELQWATTVAAALLAMSMDIRTRRIPNKFTGPLLLAGLVWAGGVAGWAGLLDSLGGVLVAGLPFFVLWMMRAGGAGDAKMMGALGAWLGVTNGFVTLLAVALAGGLVSLGYAIVRGQLRSALMNVVLVGSSTLMVLTTGRQVKSRQDLIPTIQSPAALPYGIAIFLGTCAAAGFTLWQRGQGG